MSKPKADSYQIITDAIIARLEEGKIPWQKPWSGVNSPDSPRNLLSKKPYSGMNHFILASSGYDSPYWCTYKQAKQKGGCVRKGEKATPVIYWNMIQVDSHKVDAKGKKVKKTIPLLKHYFIFNVDQCDDVKVPTTEETVEEIGEFNPIERAEEIVAGYETCPRLQSTSQRAYYSPSSDYINMPQKESFKGEEEYYATLFHEMGHSTGHGTRLNREGVVNFDHFGSHQYSKEELVAEFTSCYLCGESNILPNIQDNSVAYIQSWSKALKDDKKLIIGACSKATRAADYILGRTKETAK